MARSREIVQRTVLIGLTLTVSGRTITLDDRVAIKAGPGCKAVKGDRTKVKCTTKASPTELSIVLGDKSDAFYNRSHAYTVVEAGAGNDTLLGGPGKNRITA